MSFTTFGLHASLLSALKEIGFSRPTPIQADAIPAAMDSRDLLACAATGSGKTIAFLLPILHQLIGRNRGVTRALVLTPTRELAAQIHEDLNEIAVHTPITSAAIFGGVGAGPQEHAMRSGVDVVIATPGRLLDHLRRPYGNLSNIEFLVLDEADRMLDMGFLPDIRRILSKVPAKRQTLFFSATMPAPIGKLAQEMLKNPVSINLQRRSAPAIGITQAIYPVAQDVKSRLLLHLLQRGDMDDVLVFTRTKHRADRLAKFLVTNGLSAERIHGNRSQPQRTEALAGFKSGKYRILVATDIAARGIDVEELGHVVNFDVPKAPEDYIHRVGRTGRAEATGDAFTFVSRDEEQDLRDIEKKVGRQLPRVTLPDFDYTQRTAEKLEVSQAERSARWREQKAKERENARAKAARAQQATPGGGGGRGARHEPRASASDGSATRRTSPAAKQRPTGEGGRPAARSNRRPPRGRPKGER